jgi:hypothetical protein
MFFPTLVKYTFWNFFTKGYIFKHMGGNADIAKYWKGTAAWMNNSVKTRTNYNKTHTHKKMNVIVIKFREVTLWTLKLHNIPNFLQVRVIVTFLFIFTLEFVFQKLSFVVCLCACNIVLVFASLTYSRIGSLSIVFNQQIKT